MASKLTPVKGKSQLWRTDDTALPYAARQQWRGGRMERFATQRQALAWQAEQLAKRAAGRTTAKEAARDDALTMAKVQREYFALREDWSAATRAQQDSNWNRWLSRIVGSLHPDDVAVDHVLVIRNNMRNADRSDGTVKNVLTTLGQLLKYAIAKGQRTVAGNPVTAAKVIKPEPQTGEGRKRAMPADLVRRFLDALADDAGLAALIVYQTGARPAEVRHLQVKHFDFMRGRMDVPGTKTRSAVRNVPVPRPLLDVIAASLPAGADASTYIVRSESGGPIGKKTLETRWNDAQRIVKDAHRMYDLRHSFCSDLLDAGVPVATVAALAGHGSPSITWDYYAHSTPAGESLALAAMTKRAAASVTTESQPEGSEGSESAADLR